MKEILEIRVNYDYAYLLFGTDEGKNIGTSVRLIKISKEDPRYDQIPIVKRELKRTTGKAFFFGWHIKRKYSSKELDNAKLLLINIKTTFEPAGEECGTLYDEITACPLCGANRTQIGPLQLKRSSIPNKDIARTIAGEVVVSERFVMAARQTGLKGIVLEPVIFTKEGAKYYQLAASTEIELSKKNLAGGDPWDFSESAEAGTFNIPGGPTIKYDREVYKCPNGHTIGLNLLSEAYIVNNQSIDQSDFFQSKQKLGVKRGLLRPGPLYFCSPAFRKMVEEEKLKGFDFEIARID